VRNHEGYWQIHPARRHYPRSRADSGHRSRRSDIGDAGRNGAGRQPALLPARCFAQVGVDHVVFGPNSFFEPSTVQGPTSFRENTGPTVVTYPLYRGTSQGRDVYYVITDASDRSVAQALGVNYTPKLARAAGTAAVQNSTAQVGSGNGIDFPRRSTSHTRAS